MRWTRNTPTEPGRYMCRFLESPGVEPFEVEVVEDTINGGVAFLDREGTGHTFTGKDAPRCEWAVRRPFLVEFGLYGFAVFVVVFTAVAVGLVIWQIGGHLARGLGPGLLAITGSCCFFMAGRVRLHADGERGAGAVRPVWFVRLGVALIVAAAVWALFTV